MPETKPEVRGQMLGCLSNICPAQSEGIAQGHDSYRPYSAPALPLLPAPSPPFTLLHSLPILKVANVSPNAHVQRFGLQGGTNVKWWAL